MAKAVGWRDGLREFHGDNLSYFGVLEVAYDRPTAEAAWAENVPASIEEIGDSRGRREGQYADLSAVDFQEQVVVVWSSGQSGSCPDWVKDVRIVEGQAMDVRLARTWLGRCTDDYNPYRMLLAVDREQVPSADELANFTVLVDGSDLATIAQPYEAGLAD